MFGRKKQPKQQPDNERIIIARPVPSTKMLNWWEADSFLATHTQIGVDEDGIPIFKKKEGGKLFGLF